MHSLTHCYGQDKVARTKNQSCFVSQSGHNNKCASLISASPRLLVMSSWTDVIARTHCMVRLGGVIEQTPPPMGVYIICAVRS